MKAVSSLLNPTSRLCRNTKVGTLLGILWALLSFPTGCSSSEATPEPEPVCDVEAQDVSNLILSTEGTRFLDSSGRQIFLRGINAGGRAKFDPFFAFPFRESGRADQQNEPPFAEALQTYVTTIKSWGLNVVRLPFSWEALEPQRGMYDSVYLQRYQQTIQAFGEQGIRVIVDFHQDVFASTYCGDGFPLWAVPQPAPAIPAMDDCKGWFTGYLGNKDVNLAFDRLWANEDNLLSDFKTMWQYMVQNTAKLPGVIGYEIINEPHHGTMDKTKFYQDILTPLYTEMTTMIHGIAPQSLVFFDVAGTDGTSATTTLPLPQGTGLVFAPHYYESAVYIFGPDKVASYDTDNGVGSWAKVGEQWQVPVFVGEFGCKTGTEGGRDYLRANFNSLDKFLAHGTVWEYSATKDDWNSEGYSVAHYGGEETPSVEALVRPYPITVAGKVTSFSFDALTKQGTMVFQAQKGVSEIRIPGKLYPQGARATVSGGLGCASWNKKRESLVVRTDQAADITVSFSSR
jgi:endoglycosylceramidase